MSGKENVLAEDLDDVLQQAEESLGITPPAAKFQAHTSLNLGRYCNMTSAYVIYFVLGCLVGDTWTCTSSKVSVS